MTPSQKAFEYVLTYEVDQLIESPQPFVQFTQPGTTYRGDKFTLIGQTTDDVRWLLKNVCQYLNVLGITFKVGTRQLIDRASAEQRVKLVTVYMNADTNEQALLDDLWYLTRQYKGHEGVALQYSQHRGGCIYYRRDTDPQGRYIPASAAAAADGY